MGSKKNRRKLFISLIIAIVVIICALLFIFYCKPSVEKIKNSVVKIEIYDKNDKLLGTGSGFCIYKSDYIATNYHVINGAYSIKIIDDDNVEYDVEQVLIFDVDHDVALLKSDSNLKPLPKGNVSKIKAGDTVTAIGSPKGELNTVSTGIVSNADQKDYIRITAPISPGSSGGVLLNNKNEVIGITSATYNAEDAQNINYARSIKYLDKIYNSYNKGDYYNISEYGIKQCSSDINGEIRCALNFKYKYYSVDEINMLYTLGNINSIFDDKITHNGRFASIYSSMDSESKDKAISYYQELLEKDFCMSTCNISKNISKWDVSEFLINLEILSKEELALVMADIENYNSEDEQFNRVEDYSISAAEKSLILYLIGKKNWNDIRQDNKEDIFNYFDSKYETKDLGAILEMLGYEVEYKKDGTLTAYW